MIMSNSVVRIRGDIFEQLQQISENSSTYKIGFLFAGLTAPLTAALIVILALFVQTRKTTPILNILSVFFLLPFAFSGLVLDNKALNNATLIRGTLTIFLGVFALLIGRRLLKMESTGHGIAGE